MKAARQLLRMACILLLGIIMGFALLLAVYSLPLEPIAANVRASIPAFNGEWGSEDSYHQLVKGYGTTQLDNSTDAVMLLAAVHESDEPVVQQVISAGTYTSAGNSFSTLLDYGAGKQIHSVSVARYWHGYLVFLKPLLLVCSYLDIRMLLSIVQWLMLGMVIAGLCRRKLSNLVIPFLISLLCITPSATAFSMQFSTVLLTFLGAMLCLLYLPRLRHEHLPILFLITGMVTSYIDYLTYPVAAFGMPFVLAVFLFPKQNAKEEFLRFVMLGVCWCAGYFGMWAGKWVIAGFWGSEKWFWPNLIAKITQRSASETRDISLTYGMVLKQVLSLFAKRAYLLVFAVAAPIWGWRVFRSRRLPAKPISSGKSAVLLLCALIPFAWYFCTRNHSFNHAFFTSRALAVSVFAICALLGTFIRRHDDVK